METKKKFYKISKNQFSADNMNNQCKYEDIKLPERATKYSAGYDFFAPFDFVIMPGHSLKIPTGIRVALDEDKFLMIVPRSSLGFKYKLKIDNTVGIIDSDYFNAKNEGHIWLSMTNMSPDKPVVIKKGDAICQGIVLKYYTLEDDNSTNVREGGIGSTNK